METSNVLLRVKPTPQTPRAVSCYVHPGRDSPYIVTKIPECPSESQVLFNSSINDRLAQLKLNGEQGWKSRVPKAKFEDEIPSLDSSSVVLRNPTGTKESSLRGGSLINNRVSSLFDSTSTWKNRVMEKDAKGFSNSAKLTPMSTSKPAVTPSSDGVVLRGTPRRMGMHRCTLTESALKSVSSKLTNVLKGDKLNPLYPRRASNTSESSSADESKESKFDVEKAVLEKTKTPAVSTVTILKPDDDKSFKSFYDFNDKTLDGLINHAKSSEDSGLWSFDKITSPNKLLADKSVRRVQGPTRRAASRIVKPSQSIAIDSYTQIKKVTPENLNLNTPSKVETPKKESYTKPNLAISALAGLASTEDIKSIASKLRTNSSTINSSNNDSWRMLDLKNSIQSKMLILVKGKRRAHIRLIEPKWTSLCSHDCFILVTKDVVYSFVAQYSNIIERTKCIEVAEYIKNTKDICHRTTINKLVLVDANQDSTRNRLIELLEPMLKDLDYTKHNRKELEEKLSKTEINIDSLEDDECYEESMNYTNKIYRVVAQEDLATPKLVILEQYCGKSPRHAMLIESESYVFDYGTEMYIWIGRNVSNVHRKTSVDVAKELWFAGYDYTDIEFAPLGLEPLKADKRPDWAWFMRVNQNMEPILFKDKFFNWPAFTLTRVKPKSPETPSAVGGKKVRQVVKKDLSQELNLFPVSVKEDMINKPSPEPNCILEFVLLGRGAEDTIQDEDGLPVKINSLEIQCYFIDCNGNKNELNESDRNYLFTGETYCIRWKYRLSRVSRRLKGGESCHNEKQCGRDRLCYFLWQGRDSKNSQRGAAALVAVDKLREEGASQILVENEKEIPVFLRIFDGSLVIQRGSRNENIHEYRMFSLKTLVPNETFLVEVACTLKNFRSRLSFIFLNLNERLIYIWHGCKSSETRKKETKAFLVKKLLTKSNEFAFSHLNDYKLIEVEEGKEGKDFYVIFSNSQSGQDTLRKYSKGNLQREVYFSLMDDPRDYKFTLRLFHLISSPDKGFEAIEIVSTYQPARTSVYMLEYPFTQSDIYEVAKSRPTFFLLDNHYEVFLWESKFPFFLGTDKVIEAEDGSKFQKILDEEIQSEAVATTGSLQNIWLAERQCALETALAYCDAKDLSEPPNAYVISAGLEPDCFRGLFPTWTFFENVAQLHIEDDRKPGQQILVQEVLAQIRDINTSTYTYEELIRHPLPEGINILCIESYLDDTDFERTFKMNREEFYALPTWKQKQLKKENSLF